MKPRPNSMLKEIRKDMHDKVKIQVVQNLIAKIETTLLQYRECFTGFHEPSLEDKEHANDDEILAPFL